MKVVKLIINVFLLFFDWLIYNISYEVYKEEDRYN